MRRRGSATVAATAMLAFVTACTSLSELSTTKPDAAPVDSGAPGDAASDIVARDSTTSTDGPADSAPTGQDSAAPPNLLANGGFELGCAGWSVAFGFMSESSDAHTGTGSCEFCMDTNGQAYFSQTVNTAVAVNQTYYAEIWSKAASSLSSLADAGLSGEQLVIVMPNADQSSASNTLVTSDWSRLTAIVTTTQGNTSVELQFELEQQGNPAPVGDVICVLLDDAVLQRMP